MIYREDEKLGLLARIRNSLFRRSCAQEQNAAAYRRLALRLYYDAPSRGARSAMLVSPTASALSAPGALSLASSLARELGNSVLLVDACVAQPDVTRLLGVPDRPGWANLLEDKSTSLDSVVLPTSCDGLWFLPAGRGRSAPSSAALESALHTVHQLFDFVLISGGSLLAEASVLGLLPHVGCVLLLVTENETEVSELKAAQDTLSACKAADVRLVLTSPSRTRESYPTVVQVNLDVRAQAVGKLVAE